MAATASDRLIYEILPSSEKIASMNTMGAIKVGGFKVLRNDRRILIRYG